MSVAFSMAALSDNGDLVVQQGNDTGKGQKRRMGKNASLSNQRISSGVIASQPSTLNPHAQLRLQLVGEGIEEADIDRALEEMWERELPYDDFNAVMSFIRSRNAVKEQPEEHSESIQQPEEETKTASTAESTSTSTDERDRSSNVGVTKNMHTNETNSTTDSTGYAENSEERQLSRQRKASPVHPINMSSKLDLVADYENLADAAFALSEWVAKAADREEVCAPFFGFLYVNTCVNI